MQMFQSKGLGDAQTKFTVIKNLQVLSRKKLPKIA